MSISLAEGADVIDINERWLKDWKRLSNANRQWLAAYFEPQLVALQYYADHGKSPQAADLAQYMDPVVPVVLGWELMGVKLTWYSSMRIWEWERAAVEDGRLDAQALGSALFAHYLNEMIGVRGHTLFEQRHGKGRTHPFRVQMAVCFTAIGVLYGCKSALVLAQVQTTAAQRGVIDKDAMGPVSAFVVNVLAQYLGIAGVHVRAAARHLLKDVEGDQEMQGLLEVWRNPDAEALVPHCLAACDVHTHHSLPSSNKQYREFAVGLFTRTPVAVLLVFKLRKLLGLENPVINHPLMDSMAGQLPAQVPILEVDEILQRVSQRMVQDSFDENQIIADFLTPVSTPKT